MICDNVKNVHDPVTITDTEAIRVICKQCKHQFVVRKYIDKGTPEIREYAYIYRDWETDKVS